MLLPLLVWATVLLMRRAWGDLHGRVGVGRSSRMASLLPLRLMRLVLLVVAVLVAGSFLWAADR
jgi:hypothetical protein